MKYELPSKPTTRWHRPTKEMWRSHIDSLDAGATPSTAHRAMPDLCSNNWPSPRPNSSYSTSLHSALVPSWSIWQRSWIVDQSTLHLPGQSLLVYPQTRDDTMVAVVFFGGGGYSGILAAGLRWLSARTSFCP